MREKEGESLPTSGTLKGNCPLGTFLLPEGDMSVPPPGMGRTSVRVGKHAGMCRWSPEGGRRIPPPAMGRTSECEAAQFLKKAQQPEGAIHSPPSAMGRTSGLTPVGHCRRNLPP